MTEKLFVEQIKRSTKKRDPKSFFWKTNDRFSLGMPDLIIIMGGVWFAIEAKLMVKPSCIQHPFHGPQVSVMRQIVDAGGIAMGAVYVEFEKSAYILHPRDIPSNGKVDLEYLKRCAFESFFDRPNWDIEEWTRRVFGSDILGGDKWDS